jgi:hypothetical protein
MEIIGFREDKRMLEYLIHSSFTPSWTREVIFGSIKEILIEDYENFSIGEKKWIRSPDSPQYLQIDDTFKNNFFAVVRIDSTLSPNHTFLRLFADNLEKTETLYGSLVKHYFDKKIREAMHSVKNCGKTGYSPVLA